MNIILNYYRRKPKREIEIVLENETLTVDLINNSIKNDQDDLKVPNYAQDSYQSQYPDQS